MKFGPFELVAQRGAGSDGVSYRARHERDGTPVELCVVGSARGRPERWEELTRRLKAVALIDHPSVVRIRQLDLEHGPPFVVLDWVDAPSLTESCRDRLPLSAAETAEIGHNLTGAIAEAHRVGLILGGVKAEAIALPTGGPPRLDLTGLQTRPEDLGLTHGSFILGRAGAHGQDRAADVASVGALLSWLLYGGGHQPLDGEGLPPVGGGQATIEFTPGGPSAPHGAPGSRDALDRLLYEMTRLAPSDRPTAREAALAFAGLMAQERVRQPESGVARVSPSAETLEDSSPGSRDLPTRGPSAATRETDYRPTTAAPERLGRYRVLDKLGQGGMGAVYRGEDLADGTIVAIKVLRHEWAQSPNSLRRFQKEARLLAEVNNPFVTNLLEVNEDDGTHYIALEFVDGQSLGKVLLERGRLGEAEALAIVADITRGLADAHERGIVHRDVKPDNVILRARADGTGWVVKLSDFGLARHVVETESLQLTKAHAVVGTPHYLSPEQCVGGTIDVRTDVYALGVTMFQLLAGRVPFQADTMSELIALHRDQPPPPLQSIVPEVSDGACRIIEKALAKAPELRYPDAGAFLEEIERLQRGEATPILAHPRLPACDPRDLLEFDFEWDLQASPRQLWPLVTNTERLNRAIGLPSVDFRAEADESGAVKMFAAARQGGLAAAWREHPFEWVEPQRMGVLREYSRGPFAWMVSIVELEPRSSGGTTLRHLVRLAVPNAVMRAAARMKVGRDSRKALERVYRRIDASLTGQLGDALADPFEPAPPLSPQRRRRLEGLLDRLIERGVHPAVVERLGDFLAEAPPQEVARIRPLALARRLGLDGDQVVAACLHGASEGLLMLRWDILCPVCRIPSEFKDSLRALQDHAHCEACHLDFELDFANSVEMIFQAHPEVREADLAVYCIGGPAHSPHVVAQVRIAPNERAELSLGLSEGQYRVRGAQLPYAIDLRVEPGRGGRRAEVDLRAGPREGWPPQFRAGGQALVLHNDYDQEMVIRVERIAPREDALTAARASSLALFRELFPDEILSSGQLISITTITLLVTRLERASLLYEQLGDARAFMVIRQQFEVLEQVVRNEGGALVKTLGEGVLAAFSESASGARAALALAGALRQVETTRSLDLRVGLHRGPAMAATINDHLDYFGTTVNQALTLPYLGGADEIIMTADVAGDPAVARALRDFGRTAIVFEFDLPGKPGALLHRVGGTS